MRTNSFPQGSLIQLFFIASLSLLSVNLNAQFISCGNYYTVAVCTDGEIQGYGQNSWGQIGNGNTANQMVPDPGVVSDVVQLDAGIYHVIALKDDGTVWAWGYNGYGQLGDGTTASSTTPKQVTSLSGIVKVSAHGYTSMALKSNGTVWGWGYNIYGQLGDGSSSTKYTPVQASNLTNVIDIANGYGHSLALKSDGSIWAWGWNNYGQLGDSTNIQRYTPVQVMTGCRGIAAGYAHSFFIKNDSTVKACGYNWYGQLGNNNTLNSSIPVTVSNLSGVRKISSFYYHSFAILGNGTLKSWGWNNYGQLATGNTITQYTPVVVPNMLSITDVAMGYGHTIALRFDGVIFGWGYNWYGQLGDGSTTNSFTPVISQISCQVGIPSADAGNDTTICSGDAITIGGSPTGSGGVSPYEYTWTPSTGLNDPTIANPTASPTSSISYHLKVKDDNGFPVFDTIVVTVNPALTADAGDDAAICVGESATLGGIIPAACGSTPYTYSWNNPTSLNNPGIAHPVATPTVNTTYTLTITDNNNNTTTDQVTVTVSNLAASAGVDRTICSGDNTSIGAIPAGTGGSPPYTYSWSPPADLDNSNAQTPVADPTSNTTYTITVTDDDGCTATNDMDVTVNSLPTVSFTGLASQYCPEDPSVTLTGDPTGGTFSGSGINSNQFRPKNAGGGTHGISYSFTDGNGCKGKATQSVYVIPATEVTIAGLDPTYCSTDSPILLDGSPSSATFSGDGMTGNKFDPAAAGSGTHTITLSMVDTSGCQNTTTTDVEVFIVSPAGISGNGNVLSATDGEDFDWYWNGTHITAETTQSIVVPNFGDYFVDITDTNGCVSRSEIYTYNAVGITPTGFNGSLEVFPNPFDDAVTIKMSGNNSGNLNVEVITILGETVLQTEVTPLNGMFVKTIGLNNLPSGTYLLKVKADNGISVQRIAKF